MTIRITDDQWDDLEKAVISHLRSATGYVPTITSERRGYSIVLSVTMGTKNKVDDLENPS